MVWKATTKVAFGVKDKWVIAWYCETKGNNGGPADYKANVGDKCINDDGVNTCFNDLALKAHNAKRTDHKAKPLRWHAEAAKALQGLMDADDFEGTVGSKPTAYSDCGENVIELPC